MKGPRDLGMDSVGLISPKDGDIVVKVTHSGISTGTEKLFWSGEMPPFPGMGYPLVPGYEARGEVIESKGAPNFKVGDVVFVPGSNCYAGAHGLFGAASNFIVTAANRAIKIDRNLEEEGALLALAATARHAIAGLNKRVPDLIVGHGVLGRLLARLTIAAGAPAPTVWETDQFRKSGAQGYEVKSPEDDSCKSYHSIYDASGDSDILNKLVARLCKGGEIVLAGFYPKQLGFSFPPAFIKEARFRVAAEWERRI